MREAPTVPPAQLVSLVFPIPLHRVFSYQLPDGQGQPPAAGCRVLAPLGRRRAVGFVVEEAHALPDGVRPRAVHAVLDVEPIFSPALWSLARWIAGYYIAPLGLVLKSMLPSRLLRPPRKGAGPQVVPAAAAREERIWVEPLVSSVPPDLSRKARAQARALEALLALPGAVEAARLFREAGARTPVLKGLEKAGLVRLVRLPAERVRSGFVAPRGEAGYELTADQEGVLRALEERLGSASPQSPPPPVLLHGVTGSGKTLVYLKLVEEALARGGSAIVLVPEIGLTPRAVARFQEAFGRRVALLHSALAEGERWEAWQAMRAGEVRVAVGPRSAVFAPFARVDVTVVDEEQETSYKQEEAPRYNAREVAIMRARLEGGLAVLGSATPSLESYANAGAGKYALLSLPRRIGERELPAVEIVDMRERGVGERIFSAPLREALAANLARGEQSLLLMNRRGFSSFLQCADCGATLSCPNCRITLTLHRPRGGRAAPSLRCHYCDHREPAPEACGSCAGRDLTGQGYGTQQVEELVAELFPSARVARMDHDTTTRKGVHARLVEAMERGLLDVLVGTQMVAKGHDFPGLTLVGVVSADTSLNFPDFRAAERTFQLVAQVAGRSGRGGAPGRVLVQSYVPEHPAIQAAARHDYVAFYSSEVEARFEAGYPPALKLASCLLTGEDEERVSSAARALGESVQKLRRSQGVAERLTLVGPSPAPLARLRGRFRWHFLLKSTSPGLLEPALHRLATRWRPPRGVQLVIDRDPYNLL